MHIIDIYKVILHHIIPSTRVFHIRLTKKFKYFYQITVQCTQINTQAAAERKGERAKETEGECSRNAIDYLANVWRDNKPVIIAKLMTKNS